MGPGQGETQDPESGRRSHPRPPRARGSGGRARFFAALFDLAPDGHLVTDRAGTIRLANRVASLLLGVEQSALTGLSLFDLVPDDGRRLREQLRELEATPGPEFRVREWNVRMRRGGETFHAALTVTVVNGPRELHWGLRDVSERRRLENELRRSEARLQAILAGAFNGMLTVDPVGTVRSLNPMAERLFGYAADEATGRDVALLLPALEGEGGTRLSRLVGAAGDGAGVAHEAVARRKDGTLLVADLSVSEVRLDDERFYSIIVRDVTAQKRAGEELRASEARLRRLVESNIIGIVFFSDPAGRLTGANDAFLRMAGYDREDLEAGRLHWNNLTAPGHRSRDERALEELQRAGACTPYETECLRRDGGRVPVLLGAALIDRGRGEVVAFILDLTELRAARERALQAERLAAIGQTMTGLAHESRNAFQRSQAALERLRRRVDPRPEVRELLDELQQAQDHLHFLYEEVRSYAAPIKLELEEVDLAEVWREAWRHLAVRRDGRRIELREQLDGSGTRVRADARRVGQVFRNVLENALDASPDPGVIVVRCAAAELAGAPALAVAVCDDGPGFSPAQRQRLFEPFFTTKTRGTGLGMAIARRILDAHGGRIEVGPGPCPGAEVLITLTRRGP